MTDIRSVTDLKSTSSEMVERVRSTRRPIIITQKGQPRAVLVDLATWEATQESIAMLKLMVQGETDVREGRVVPHAEVRARLRRQPR